jgi:hypothetical protein
LKQMLVGEPVRFSIGEDQYIEVDRAFMGMEEAWILYKDEEKQVIKNLDEVVQIISRYWSPSLKKIIEKQFSELMEIEDLGEY